MITEEKYVGLSESNAEVAGMKIENQISGLVESKFQEAPVELKKITTGLCNEVYLIKLKSGEEFILRFNSDRKDIAGSSRNIPLFREYGIKVPEIVFEDYTKSEFPCYYQILSKIDGQDIGQVFFDLDEDELRSIAGELSEVTLKLRKMPTNGRFGYVGENENSTFDSWLDFILSRIREWKSRDEKTNVLGDEFLGILDDIIEKYSSYFESVESELYYDDMCSKNIMINKGKFSGIVDLDSITYGDYLEVLGTIQASYLDTESGDIYLNSMMENLDLNGKEREMVDVYTVITLISWLTEEGVEFNTNTTTEINWDEVASKKEKIRRVYQQIESD
ncbi:phosphotransferase family protein [Patescibacteria group bacterium]